jgi:hypothetical protein
MKPNHLYNCKFNECASKFINMNYCKTVGNFVFQFQERDLILLLSCTEVVIDLLPLIASVCVKEYARMK